MIYAPLTGSFVSSPAPAGLELDVGAGVVDRGVCAAGVFAPDGPKELTVPTSPFNPPSPNDVIYALHCQYHVSIPQAVIVPGEVSVPTVRNVARTPWTV